MRGVTVPVHTVKERSGNRSGKEIKLEGGDGSAPPRPTPGARDHHPLPPPSRPAPNG